MDGCDTQRLDRLVLIAGCGLRDLFWIAVCQGGEARSSGLRGVGVGKNSSRGRDCLGAAVRVVLAGCLTFTTDRIRECVVGGFTAAVGVGEEGAGETRAMGCDGSRRV